MIARLKSYGSRVVKLGMNWAAIKLAFVLGVVVGFLIMAVAMVTKDATVGLVKVGRAVAEKQL